MWGGGGWCVGVGWGVWCGGVWGWGVGWGGVGGGGWAWGGKIRSANEAGFMEGTKGVGEEGSSSASATSRSTVLHAGTHSQHERQQRGRQACGRQKLHFSGPRTARSPWVGSYATLSPSGKPVPPQ